MCIKDLPGSVWGWDVCSFWLEYAVFPCPSHWADLRDHHFSWDPSSNSDVMFLAIATVHSATIVQIALAQASLSLSVWPMNEAKANVDHTWPLLRFVNWCFAVLPLSTFLWKSVFQRLKCFNQNSHYFSEMYQSKSKELWLSIRPRTV